jgi:hypothetical protein
MIATIALLGLLVIAGSGGGGGGGSANNSQNLASNNWKEIDENNKDDADLIEKYKTTEYKNNSYLDKNNLAKTYALLEKNKITANAGDNVKIATSVVSRRESSTNLPTQSKAYSYPGVNYDNTYIKSNLISSYELSSDTHYDIGDINVIQVGRYGLGENDMPITGDLKLALTSYSADNNQFGDDIDNLALNTINVIAGTKSLSSSDVDKLDSHGIAYNSKISQIFLYDYDKLDNNNNHFFSVNIPTIDEYGEGSKGHYLSIGPGSIELLARENYKIYNYNYNYSVNPQDINDKETNDFKNVFFNSSERGPRNVLLVANTGDLSDDSKHYDYLSYLVETTDNKMKLFKGTVDRDSSEDINNIIFTAPLKSEDGTYKIEQMYKSLSSGSTNPGYRSCEDSAMIHCIGVLNPNKSADNSYNYLKEGVSNYNGDALADKNGNNVNMNLSSAVLTGAAGIILSAWPSLKASQVAEIIYETADRPDIAKTSTIYQDIDGKTIQLNTLYGRGILNIYNAVNAQGKKSIPSSNSIQAIDYPIDNTQVRSAPIFGDAFTSSVAPQLSNAVFLDKYGRDYKAFLENKFSTNSQSNSFSLNNFAFNSINNNSNSISFDEGKQTRMRFNYSQFRDQKAKNIYGLRNAVIDRSVDPQNQISNNFGFAFNFEPKSLSSKVSMGFAFNTDEMANQDSENFGISGFLAQGNNFSSNPYQSFFSSNTQNLGISQNQSVRKFNQIYLKNKLSSKLGTRFSYTSSFDSQSYNPNFSGKKQNQVLNFGLDLKPNDSNNISISVGQLREFDNNMLNSKSYGAFETQGNAQTSFVKVSASQNIIDNLKLISSISEGITRLKGNDRGIFRSYENIHSRSMSYALQYDGIEKNKFGIAYSEPMRVYKGSVNYDIPVGLDNQGNVLRKQGSASLAPNGKQRDYEFFYQHDVSDNSNLRLNLLMQKELNNFRSAPNNYVGYLSYTSSF